MRDKVKRFLSILMTALMLVNLLPVGALAEGMKLDSNSVQSKVSLTADPETAPIVKDYVYVYVKIDGASPETLAKFKLNSSGWYMIGSIRKDMPGKGKWEPYWYGGGEWVITPTPSDTKTYQPGDNTGAGVLPAYSIVGLKPWEDNKLIPLGNVRWTGYKLTTGANNYQPESIFSWHMDGIVNFKEINVPYTVKHVVKKSSPEIVLKEETKNQKYGQWTEAQALKFEGYKHVGEIVNQKIGDDPITIYVYYEPDKKQTVDVTYKTSEGGTIKNGGTYKIQPVTGNLSGGGRLPSSTPTANAGYEFAGWERDDGQTYNDLNDVYSKLNQKTADAGTYTLYQNTTFTARFEKKANLSYTVNYYWGDDDDRELITQTKSESIYTYNQEVDVTPTVPGGYTPMPGSGESKTITITEGTNEINFYYYKNVELTANSAEFKYDGTQQSVSGFTGAPEGADFSAINVGVSGTDADTYPANFPKDILNTVDGTGKYIVTEANPGTLTISKREVTLTSATDSKKYDGTALTNGTVTVGGADGFADGEGAAYDVTGSRTDVGESDNTFTYTLNKGTKADNYTIEKTEGKLKVTPVTEEVVVTITENSDTVTYDGGDHIVSGYASMTADNELYDVDASVQETPTAAWTAKGTDVGEYPVGIAADDFKNINTNFTNVKFVVVDGKLTITPAPVTLQAPIASKTYDGEPLKAEDYVHSYVEGVNFADDFAAVILTGSQTLVGSSSSLITDVIPKEGKKLKNYKFTFLPGTLTVTDGTGDDPVKPENVVTKTHIPKDMGYNLGEPVTFTISVKNIYNTPKTITLTEKENVKFSNGESVIVFKDVPAGETVTAEATYTITSEDILAGVFHNTVTADFTGGGSWTAEDTVTTAELDTTLNVTKTSDVPEGQKAALGQTITYTIKVQNAGNVPYTNVKVEDPLTKLTATIETLPVGETRTFTTEYVVTEADVLEGHVLNTATATGDKIKDPKSDEPKEPNGGDEVEIKTFAPITIKPKDVTATYNGAAITGKDVEITSGKLLEGHKLSAAVIGSGVNAGSYELTLDPEKITIVDANNKDVSEMYARTILPGKLIINKRSVLITSQSATKTYDGSALTRPAVTITGDGFVPGELAKAEATGSITKVGSTPNAIQYTTTGAFNAANYSIALSVGTLTVTEKPKPEPRRTFNLTINYVYQNGKRAAASYNRGGLKNGETFDITSPVIAGYTASETVVSGTIYNRDIKVTVIYTADGVNLDDYGVPLGLGNITMNVGDCFE